TTRIDQCEERVCEPQVGCLSGGEYQCGLPRLGSLLTWIVGDEVAQPLTGWLDGVVSGEEPKVVLQLREGGEAAVDIVRAPPGQAPQLRAGQCRTRERLGVLAEKVRWHPGVRGAVLLQPDEAFCAGVE